MKSVDAWPQHDEVPWCSAFVSFVCELLGLERPELLKYDRAQRQSHGQGPLQARTWLRVGAQVQLVKATRGYDVVVFARGGGGRSGAGRGAPDHTVIDAPGHVGFYAGHRDGLVQCLGGNQSDTISHARYPVSRLLGIRRITRVPLGS